MEQLGQQELQLVVDIFIDRCRLLLRFRHRSKEERSDRPSRAEDVKWLGGPGRGDKDLLDENR
ncbi:hypothetical protein T08_8393 [Trichinella sp. T8]|nr:hypothetical protein T08_8393 [Trichinella sp. T8]